MDNLDSTMNQMEAQELQNIKITTKIAKNITYLDKKYDQLKIPRITNHPP